MSCHGWTLLTVMVGMHRATDITANAQPKGYGIHHTLACITIYRCCRKFTGQQQAEWHIVLAGACNVCTARALFYGRLTPPASDSQCTNDTTDVQLVEVMSCAIIFRIQACCTQSLLCVDKVHTWVV